MKTEELDAAIKDLEMVCSCCESDQLAEKVMRLWKEFKERREDEARPLRKLPTGDE
jgi:hypothetical protein